MALDPQGKTAIVTGAGSGINLEFARLLLRHGANVLFADIALRPEAQALINQYQSKPKAAFQKTDVTSWTDLENMFKAAEKQFGSIDIVCPGAGVFEPPWSNFWHPPGSAESKDDRFGDRYRSIDINLTHPIRVTQLAISHFLGSSPPASPSNPKSIVHIASVAGQTASLPFPMYHAAKHGVQALVRCMESLEQSHGIRVTAVEPGVVKTPLFTEHPEKLKAVDREKDAWVTPEKVAEVMLACVKDQSIAMYPEGEAGVDGEAISIHGGSCLEVLTRRVRDVPMFNNVGPLAGGEPGGSASNVAGFYSDVQALLQPGWGQ
ncbi:3-hydroxybutyrate dehydrogenase [Exophiala aquamarina CBS 119918]|uniref:3-hydroxybutyrate dehydrogenase n=1 Tax=Exophiala aquamarina CBS 119918 TaxID=1182545 RepID=A0A072PN94_9EURO|nr:3-hydroxybutyrate dehydrogenase [Exophiala aquamarina CBS 119918]KEF61569.1 3-hydroxybutyrate dehydrogenase [Exophiala aquamarina CBS 119918]